MRRVHGGRGGGRGSIAVQRGSIRHGSRRRISTRKRHIDLLGDAYLEPLALGNDPAAQIYREALAGPLAVRAASQQFPIGNFTVLIRGDCAGALDPLLKSSFRLPTLQDMMLQFNELFMRLTPHPSILQHAPGAVMKAEGLDDLSLSDTADRRAAESTSALRTITAAEADNAVLPRFNARHAEPLTEGQDALVQPGWGRS